MNDQKLQSPRMSPTSFSGGGAGGALARVGPSVRPSSLASLPLSRPRTSDEMRKMATEVWRSRGLALLDPLLIDDDSAREALLEEATRLYGRRHNALEAFL